ncbi:hypothetical protein [Brevibacillus nitrificans]|uniref:hypothetical protein n=1 Tax=Brevibacillus nitrificans TaxID=651560 RepID=UPI0028569537|nr:hypothetical protein [Brevibacillus nitrificans]MDR7315705.1 hypothetical protein [Brevibacillus nitrificans]
MRSKWITSVLLTCLLTLLSGCWDQKSIQDMIYLSAFGIDFVDNEYVIYAQSSDLASVAKQEGAATGSSPPAVVSIGRGETLQTHWITCKRTPRFRCLRASFPLLSITSGC